MTSKGLVKDEEFCKNQQGCGRDGKLYKDDIEDILEVFLEKLCNELLELEQECIAEEEVRKGNCRTTPHLKHSQQRVSSSHRPQQAPYKV